MYFWLPMELILFNSSSFGWCIVLLPNVKNFYNVNVRVLISSTVILSSISVAF